MRAFLSVRWNGAWRLQEEQCWVVPHWCLKWLGARRVCRFLGGDRLDLYYTTRQLFYFIFIFRVQVGISPRASPALPFFPLFLFQFPLPLPPAFYRGGGQGGREDIERVLERAYGWGLAIAGGASLGVYPVMPVRNI
jgi:hypothetical protein